MIPLNGKTVTLDQLQAEMAAQGLNVNRGLGIFGDFIFPYDAIGNPAAFSNVQAAQSVLTAHVPMRTLTDQELNILYAQANDVGDTTTMHAIVAMAQGLIPRKRVPV